MSRRKPKAEEMFHADVDSGSGKRIRLIATLTNDGWASGRFGPINGRVVPTGAVARLGECRTSSWRLCAPCLSGKR